MEALCGFCEFLGVAPHCNNCKMKKLNDSQSRPPMHIKEPLKDMIDKIERGEASSYAIGDWKEVELPNRQRVKIYVLAKEADILEDGTTADITFGILNFPNIHVQVNTFLNQSAGWDTSTIRTETLPLIWNMLPKTLREHIVPVQKETCRYGVDETYQTTDKLFLFSETEICNRYCGRLVEEGQAYPFFQKPSNLMKMNATYTFLRTQKMTSRIVYSAIREGRGYSSDYSNEYHSLAFGFCLSSRQK